MMDFKRENTRIYVEDNNGQVIAEVLFPLRNGVYTITRTFVDESLRGQGVAQKLMEAVRAVAMDDDIKIDPACSYAKKYFDQEAYRHLTV